MLSYCNDPAERCAVQFTEISDVVDLELIIILISEWYSSL